MPPEAFDKENGYSYAFDVWSFGCVLYEVVVGRPPFGEADSGYEDMQKILDVTEIRMQDYFSSDFKDLLYGLLDRDSSRRLTLSQA